MQHSKGKAAQKRLSSSSIPTDHLALAAIGLESEFTVFINDRHVKPEQVFGSPKAFIRGPAMHRTGTSYHLPTGAAVYFDTGVIEIATPVIEIDRGCVARAGRSLWESILCLREELDVWQVKARKDVRLAGFSTHYNISFDLPEHDQVNGKTIEKLALLLSYIIPFPVMLLAANRRSTGIGVRPRGNRIEITADFTPDAALMIAAGTLITGIVREVMTWPSFEISILDNKKLPVISDFEPIPHTSRQGWLAKFSCYPRNPFTSNIDEALWHVRNGEHEGFLNASPGGLVTLRTIAKKVFKHFWRSIARVADPFTFRLIRSVMDGGAPSLLELDDRPEEYDHVGRLCTWNNLFPEKILRRSRYEQVLIHAINGERLWMHGKYYIPIGMRGWSQIVFKGEGEDRRHIFSIDYLLQHLRDWSETANKRRAA